MIRKILSLLLCSALLLAVAFPSAVGYRGEAEEIIEYKMAESGAKNAAEWAQKLAESAGGGAEWYAIALRGLGNDVDLGAYAQALANHLGKSTLNATNTQRCALGFLAAGCKSAYIAYAAENTIGSMGIMSYIWGLILLTNGAESTKFTPASLAEKIAGFRLADGGFALSGEVSNVDVTAMAIAALAPYRENAAVGEAIDGALAFLASVQTENGGFINYGVENCESSAQVIIALASLGIDPAADERFMENGKNAVDSMRSFALAGGGFSHAAGGEYNENATQQALLAFAALARLEEGKGPLFVFDEQADKTPADFIDVNFAGGDKTPQEETKDMKTIICVAIITVCAVGIAVVLLIPKKQKEE